MSLDSGTISRWHVVISGLLQREGAPNGMLRLAVQLHREHSASDCMVEMHLWHDRMSSLAEKIWLLRPPRQPPLVRLYAYSWGGAAALRLAAELKQRGLPVESIVLSDAVYRHWYWAGNWRAFWPYSRLLVPENVRRIEWFRQQQNLPAGHAVVAANPRATQVMYRGELDRSHQYMDDAPAFQQRALQVARSQ